MLLQTGLLEAISVVSLRFSRQAKLFECVPNLQCAFRAVLGMSMMQMYKKAVKEEEETTKIHEEVLECWELLVKKGGNIDWYRDTFIKK